MSQSSKPLIPRLRCLATLLQQLNAQTACDAVNEAIESIESTEALRQSQSLPAGAVVGGYFVPSEVGDLECSLAVAAEWDKREDYIKELQADAADARRYRWLCMHPDWSFIEAMVYQCTGKTYQTFKLDLDAAIDADKPTNEMDAVVNFETIRRQ